MHAIIDMILGRVEYIIGGRRLISAHSWWYLVVFAACLIGDPSPPVLALALLMGGWWSGPAHIGLRWWSARCFLPGLLAYIFATRGLPVC